MTWRIGTFHRETVKKGGRASVAQERVRLLRTGAESGEETEGGRVGVGGEGGGGGKGGEEEEEEESSCAFCFAWPLAGESATSVRTQLVSVQVWQRRDQQFHNLAKRDGVLEASRSDEEVRTKADTRHGKAEQSDRIQQEREKNKRMHRRVVSELWDVLFLARSNRIRATKLEFVAYY